MKSIYTRACIVAALMVGAMFAAQAADLPNSFKATTLSGTQTTITPERLASFECAAGQFITVREDTNPAWYVDAGGALCAKFKLLPDFAENWVQQPGAQRWFRVNWYSMQCSAGGTQVTYAQNFPALNDGCQLDTLIKAKSN